MEKYNHKKIEKKWQEKWDKDKPHKAEDFSKKEKSYLLIEFPYPSGDGLHVGHPRPYIGMDVIARKRRAEGKNVLYPIGWDAFGLPTENFALKTGVHPKEVTKKNTDIFRKQIKSLGISFDWSREINTTDPEYYKWTQWIFLQLFKKGLAYKASVAVNWCLSCKIGLANEEVVDGKCERCGGETEKRQKEQWMLAITKYADRLDKDLDDVDYSEPIKIQQRNWIGKSEGAEIDFDIKNSDRKIKIFTTRADTLFGSTYMVLAPEHELVQELKSQITNFNEAEKYINDTKKKTEIERTAEGKEKTGVELKGVTAINPANKEEIPVFIADYVMVEYGTGAIMAVPAHDQRDFEFAKKFNLPIVEADLVDMDEVIEKVKGKKTIKYKLRDWVFSRQRYWGEPIPIIHCDECGPVAVPEEHLPVELPDIKDYKPTDSGESPLSKAKSWVNVKCPKCGKMGKRETDVMPNWAGSSWYYLRYADPNNDKALADAKNLKYWTPVDWYNGGMEHTTLHLLYSRFWHKFLYDIKVVPTPEPYQKRTSHGLILAEGGEKMSKSKGNVVNPDEIVETFGADTLRTYEMFMGPFDQVIAWSTNNMVGVRRFLEKIWRLQRKIGDGSDVILDGTIKKVTDDIEAMKFNTAVSTMMILVNELEKTKEISKNTYEKLLILLAPFAPHIAEELWDKIGNSDSILSEVWPKYDSKKTITDKAEIAVQVDGKVRATIPVSIDDDEDSVKEKALSNENVKKWTDGKNINKVLYVKGKIISIVTG
ncbi:MAG: class I tRNA ligase family protein [Candidatus Pacebacteria bacterium]|jgi:leucyl-tRNA synthetase|nr:class I tRNA ligase family protein [Candidatus Paceibacterota bacterium]MDP7159124.1 class I tRNA ligase family protein [Candidatus Paceibacterota bacterium]MDP7368075.1 class I tRNA ligase family protein [Candidatus Paceibacterota bacterium]MDP7466009.1 class I tRNA ligase family protein [Candidatus Paceibacterota bacterium]MDP7648277.1 class I tRNA ligase family protein [Candidatus Paceibacterota bacterium]|tara:strand:+ start:2667 stop:4961 length:2295 start_codon:yes stop_codon:yes gene_type:complete